LRRFVIFLLALAVAVVGCSSQGEEIATVGDATIHLADVGALFEGDTMPIDDVFLDTLFRLMAVEALDQAVAAEFGAEVDPAAVESYVAEFEATMAEQDLTPAQFIGIADASFEMVRFNAELLALRDLAIERLLVAPETVEALFADPVALTTVCVRHILVETPEEADGVLARLQDGEDFAALADEVSLDTGTPGGDLGCAAATGYVTEFAQAAVAAPLGEIVGPVETSFGFHVLTVSERTAPTREDYLADPRTVLPDSEISRVWTDWLNDVLQTADAWVAERYGTWTPIGIRAPEAETTTTSSAG